jgi:hypothetical protein
MRPFVLPKKGADGCTAGKKKQVEFGELIRSGFMLGTDISVLATPMH